MPLHSVLWLLGTPWRPWSLLGLGSQGSKGGQALQPLSWGLISGNTVLQLLWVYTVPASPTCPLPPKNVLLLSNCALGNLHEGLLFMST